jgi:cytidylate kinase
MEEIRMKTNKVAFSGKMCSGKTTMAEYLVNNHGFTRVAIGDQIKKVSNMMIEDMAALQKYLNEMTPEFSEEIYAEFAEYKELNKDAVFVKQGPVYVKNEAYRGLTQKTGDIVRSKYGSDVWIMLLMKEADKIIENNGKVVCDDVRLKVEKEIFENEEYVLFKLEIDVEEQEKRILNMYNTYDPKALEHKTETDLDDVVFSEDVKIDTSVLSIEECYQYIENQLK